MTVAAIPQLFTAPSVTDSTLGLGLREAIARQQEPSYERYGTGLRAQGHKRLIDR